MASEDLIPESSQELTLSDEVVNQQAAQAAVRIIMEANKESSEVAAAEAKIVELESAIADAVGDAAVVPIPIGETALRKKQLQRQMQWPQASCSQHSILLRVQS